MLPVDTGDGQRVFLLGVRDNQADAMRYLRIPADPESEMDTFLRLRSALQDPKLREQAARAYVAKAIDSSRSELSGALAQSATKALELFAGQTDKKGPDGKPLGGLQAISDFMESNVPAAERERAGEVLVRILNGVLFEMAQIVRAQAGQAPLEPSEQTQSFMTQAVFSLSDSQFYPVPMVFMLQDFKQVQASVFQVARAPGKNVVYLGCLFLIIGVFCMLYVRDRRIWIWLTPRDGQSHAEMALSTNRKTLDGDREFAMLAGKLIGAEPIHKKPRRFRMNTATTTTLTLNEGFFARRNWFDWVFAALVAAGLLYALQRYGEYMDVYEKCILVGTIPAAIWLGWFWRSLRALMLVVAGLSLLAIALYQGPEGRSWRARTRCSASSTSCPASRPSSG